eukprot:gnl/TRDRNA2_/TRDRNA2_168554_c2_seq3.p1 gnl/TRDRNA2_/TRDRNA2_168554_c2~~gnl/TRDRNA2_/TRDRNA2_168554_c2_seq3.p1  ORF type:complete len:532 (+),score=155.14 gnl/TRDRNA2_/TRDRNA2_168554_c2_seq3:132-1727(+)
MAKAAKRNAGSGPAQLAVSIGDRKNVKKRKSVAAETDDIVKGGKKKKSKKKLVPGGDGERTSKKRRARRDEDDVDLSAPVGKSRGGIKTKKKKHVASDPDGTKQRKKKRRTTLLDHEDGEEVEHAGTSSKSEAGSKGERKKKKKKKTRKLPSKQEQYNEDEDEEEDLQEGSDDVSAEDQQADGGQVDSRFVWRPPVRPPPRERAAATVESDDDSFFGDDSAEQTAVATEPSLASNKKNISDERKIFVGNLPYSMSEHAVYEDFAKCGDIDRFDMPKTPDGRTSGHAFVYYNTEDGVAKALMLDGKPYHGKDIKVKRAVPQGSERRARDEKSQEQKARDDELTLFVGNLAYEVDEDVLREAFENVESVRMPRDADGNSRGVSFILFKTRAAVQSALEWNGEHFHGRALKVSKPLSQGDAKASHSKGKGKSDGKASKHDPDLTVFVGGLSKDTDAETLRQDFKECGKITDVRLVKDLDGRCKGVGFVVFGTPAGVRKALEWDGEYYGDRKLSVSMAQKSSAGAGGGKKGGKGK